MFLAGDFNINLLKSESHLHTENFLNETFSHFHYPTINQPTHFTETNATLIDNIFTNNVIDDYTAGIITTDISDHLPIFYISHEIINSSAKAKTTVSKTVRIINDLTLDTFTCELSAHEWNPRSSDNPDVHYESFVDDFCKLYNKSFPPKVIKTKIHHNKLKPWLTANLIKSIQKKNKLYKKWLKCKSIDSMIKYKRYKNTLTKTLKIAEKMYYSDRFTEIAGDMKRTWNLIRNIISPNNVKSCNITEIKDQDKIINDPNEIANKFNEYFTNIGSNLAKNIPTPAGSFLDYINTTNMQKSLFLNPVTTDEIIDVVNIFSANKASGHDDISPKVIKRIIPLIAEQLACIFNKIASLDPRFARVQLAILAL
jgi:hypothetical protein